MESRMLENKIILAFTISVFICIAACSPQKKDQNSSKGIDGNIIKVLYNDTLGLNMLSNNRLVSIVSEDKELLFCYNNLSIEISDFYTININSKPRLLILNTYGSSSSYLMFNNEIAELCRINKVEFIELQNKTIVKLYELCSATSYDSKSLDYIFLNSTLDSLYFASYIKYSENANVGQELTKNYDSKIIEDFRNNYIKVNLYDSLKNRSLKNKIKIEKSRFIKDEAYNSYLDVGSIEFNKYKFIDCN